MRLLIEAQKTYNICMNMNDVYAGPRGLSKKYPASDIGILGGTFDPIHRGHIEIAERVFMEFSLSSVLIMVSGDPPHKKRSDMASARQRYEMACLACSSRGFIIPSDIELKRTGKIYTVDTMKILRGLYPHDNLHYIIGADTLYELEGWKDPEELMRLTSFICIGRPGRSRLDNMRMAARLKERYGADIRLSDAMGPDISSTRIREMIAAGEDTEGLLDTKVKEYIDRNGLYKGQE